MTFQEFRYTCEVLGLSLHDREVRKMFDYLDVKTRDSILTLEDFSFYINNNSNASPTQMDKPFADDYHDEYNDDDRESQIFSSKKSLFDARSFQRCES